MSSKITLKFNGCSQDGDYIVLRNDLAFPSSFLEVFKNTRTSSNEIQILPNSEAQAFKYYEAILADYGTSGEYIIISEGGGEVSIEHSAENYFTGVRVTNTNPACVELVSIVNTPDILPINITDISFIEDVTDACNNVTVLVTTDNLAVKVNSPVQINPNSNNPFQFDWVRGDNIYIEVENSQSSIDFTTIQLPDKLSITNTDIDILNSPNGATITVNVSNSFGLTLEYSLDSVTFQSSNTFSGILEGNYTMHIKDQLGCVILKNFDVPNFEENGVGVDFPIALLPSKSNSFRFFKLADFSKELPNDENTLACQSPYIKNAKESIQFFQTSDIITTQIKSNYENITAEITDNDGSVFALNVNKKTNNIALNDKRDAFIYDLGNSQTGIYFLSGQTYDFFTNAPIGNYALNGGLPNWGVLGNFVQIGTDWHEIINIIYDQMKKADVLIIDVPFNLPATSTVVGSVYNSDDFEVYEFITDFGTFENKHVQIQIKETDSRQDFEDTTFVSDIINVKNEDKQTIKLEYWNSANTDIMYSTGIRHVIHIPLLSITGQAIQENENDKTDTNAYLIEADVYEGDSFSFRWQTKEMMRKIVIALNHEHVLINEVPYVVDGEIEVDAVTLTNLYKVTASMIKSENVYTTRPTAELPVNSLDYPKLVSTQGSFVAYGN